MQALSASDFLKVLEAMLIVSAPCLGHAASIKASVLDILAAFRAPRTLQADAAQACTDAITAVSEAAHACWVRLLNARYALRLIHHYTQTAVLYRRYGLHARCVGLMSGQRGASTYSSSVTRRCVDLLRYCSKL